MYPKFTSNLKMCRACRQVKPTTDFVVDGRFSDGLKPDCFECRKAQVRAEYGIPDDPLPQPFRATSLADYEGQEIPLEEWERLRPIYCTSCGANKPAEQFYAFAANATGFHTHCKECMAYRTKLRRMVKTKRISEEQRQRALADYLREKRNEMYQQLQAEADRENQLESPSDPC